MNIESREIENFNLRQASGHTSLLSFILNIAWNVRSKNVKLLVKDIGVSIYDLGSDSAFLYMISKALTPK